MIDEKGVFNNIPYPRSNRILLWYGWKDDPENDGKKWLKYWHAKRTFQCMGMLSEHRRCHRKTVLGSPFCFAHLAEKGLKQEKVYKSNNHSRVVDTISKVVASGNFFENGLVIKMFGEKLKPEEHVKRYQDPNRCGPQEFGYVKRSNPNEIHYIDFVQASDATEFLKTSPDGNCYIDFDNSGRNLDIRALRIILAGEEIKLNSRVHANSDYELLEQATPNTAYYIETFAYRSLPSKYYTLDYDTIKNEPELKGPRNNIGPPPDENEVEDEMDVEQHIDALAAQTPDKSVTSNKSHISIKNENLRSEKANPNLNHGYDKNPALSPISFSSDYLNALANYSPAASVKTHFSDTAKSLNASFESVVPHTPAGSPPPLTPEQQARSPEFKWNTQSTDYSTPPKKLPVSTPVPKPRQKIKTPPEFKTPTSVSEASQEYETPPELRSPEEPIDYGPLVPIKNANQYEREYYVIPNYHNIFGTENLLAVAKSTIRNAGLGLFAVLRSNEKISEGQIVFAFKGDDEPNPIDEYKGKILHHPNESKMAKIIADSKSKYLFELRPDFVIDAQKPLSCYARYANDNANESKLNAELINMPPIRKNRNEPKEANRVYLRFLKDIHNNEEIFCAYGENYWTDSVKR